MVRLASKNMWRHRLRTGLTIAGIAVAINNTDRRTRAVIGALEEDTTPPGDLTNAVAVGAGQFHGVAVTAQGTVRAWCSRSS